LAIQPTPVNSPEEWLELCRRYRDAAQALTAWVLGWKIADEIRQQSVRSGVRIEWSNRVDRRPVRLNI
jgi:hypothetical protein